MTSAISSSLRWQSFARALASSAEYGVACLADSFVRYVGLSPLEVITCATKTGAEVMGRGEEIGTLEAGKLADVLVVDGDVVGDIRILEDRSKFIAVMQNGVVKAGRLA